MGLQQRLDGLREADDVRVVAHQLHLGLALADNLDDVHGANLGRVGVQLVQVGDDLFLVGNGDVQPTQVDVLRHHLGEVLDAGDFEVDILCVDVLRLEFLIEVGY